MRRLLVPHVWAALFAVGCASTPAPKTLEPAHLPRPPPGKGCYDLAGASMQCSHVDSETVLALRDQNALSAIDLTLDAPVDLRPLAAQRDVLKLALRTEADVDVSSAIVLTSVEDLTIGSRA